jgi:hypothetical protein
MLGQQWDETVSSELSHFKQLILLSFIYILFSLLGSFRCNVETQNPKPSTISPKMGGYQAKKQQAPPS